jgi:sulfonate transport system substrate-binding protein
MRETSVRRAALAAVLSVLLLGACSADASTRAADDGGGTTTTAAQVALPDEIPPGTTLRVGDQLEYLQTVLRLAGEDQDFPYEVEYSSFVGGPPMLQAFQGGALDTGFVASTPLIFAQAQGQDIVAVAGWASDASAYDLVTAPGVDDIDGWEDLAGKRVAYQRGTASEAALLQALDAADIDPSEVTTVDLPITQTSAALAGGSADAGIIVEPLTSGYLGSNPTAAAVDQPTEITNRASFVIATADALDDPARQAALADYVARLVRSFTHLRDNPELVAQSVYVDQYGLSPERAAEIVEAQGVGSFIDLPGDVLDQQQVLADLFVDAGQIPAPLDVAAEFDGRFNDLVQEVQGG